MIRSSAAIELALLSALPLIARRPEFHSRLVKRVTPERAKEHCGGTLSLRAGPQGKTMGTALLLSALSLAAQGNERVREYFADVCLGKAERSELPNVGALNFLLYPQGKTMRTALLRMEIDMEDAQ